MASRSILRVFEAAQPAKRQVASEFVQACSAVSSRPRDQQTHRRQCPTTSSHPYIQRHHFSSTPLRTATIVTRNPRKDDDGNEMHIDISERAAKRLKQIVSTPPKKNSLTSTSSSPDSHLRVTVTAGGCHGFQYLMSLEPADKVDPEEDTIFEFEDDAGSPRAKAEVVMDQPSLELLKGSTVDFTTELIGSQFKIVGNPRATSSCGCGTSFDIEG